MTGRLGRRGRPLLALAQPLHRHVVVPRGQLQRQLRTYMPLLPLGRHMGPDRDYQGLGHPSSAYVHPAHLAERPAGVGEMGRL
eukprot:4217068-Pyramimonas_sp.AAC.1